MNKFLWNLSQVLAHSLSYETSQEFGGVEAYNFDFSDNSTTSKSNFKRQGVTKNTKGTTIPSFLKDVITSNVGDSKIPTSLSSGQDNFLAGLLGRDNTSPPGVGYLQQQMSIDPTQYDGKGLLQTLASRDPFSDGYKNDTSARYEDTVRQGLAQVGSSPDAVRGGQNRVSLSKGEALDKMALNRTDEIRRAQLQDSSMGSQAAQIMAAVEAGRRAIITGSQDQWVKQFLGGQTQGVEAARSVDARRGINTGNTALAAKTLGTEYGEVDENLTGVGNQSGSSEGWNAGLNCCFIFLEALNGNLPWYCRRGRDIFQTPQRRAGYVQISKWLVPMMAKYPLVKRFVNFALVKPFLKLGAWYFADESAKPRWKFYGLYCVGWMSLWQFLGRKETK